VSGPWETIGSLVVIVLSVLGGLVLAESGYRALRRAGRRVWLLGTAARHVRRPAQLLVPLVAMRFAVAATTSGGVWRDPLLHALTIGVIVAGGWMVGVLLLGVADMARSRLRVDQPENRTARQVQTQVVVIRRLAVALVTVVTVGIALTTFDAVRAFGATMLASAGIAGVIAGLAAQTTLGNLFAGLQLAFGGALRLEDIVVVEGEWGRVEELTLCYAVVRIWDDRRLVLPTSYFTTQPFTVWTRRGGQLLASVELSVDWTVPVPQLRAELERFLDGHPLWDGRDASLQVTGAGDQVTVVAFVTAADAATAWDLRCAVREHLVEWLRTNHPDALPRQRTELTGTVTTTTGNGSARWSVPAPSRLPDRQRPVA
jgi:small-conductance mechanosensitive channel